LFLDVVGMLTAYGYNANDIPAKLEGITFGQNVKVGGVTKHTFYIANDNDFIATITDSNHPNGIANPNQFFVFAFDDAELPGLVKQRVAQVFQCFDDDIHRRRERD